MAPPSDATSLRRPSGATEHFGTFLRQFLRSPNAVASPLPSSRRMVARLLEDVPWERIETFVEFGPGTGSFTAHVLDHLRPDAQLFAIDTDAGFTTHLRERFDDDERLVPLRGSATDVTALLARRGVRRVDCILSGLPFSAQSEPAGRAIICQSARLLGTEGQFLAYQVRRTIEPYLRACFSTVSRRRHWLHVPPCQLFTASGARPCVR